MALIVTGCAGSSGDQPLAPATPTAALTPTPTQVAHSPRIVFEREEFDLGDLPVDKCSCSTLCITMWETRL